MSLNSSYLSDKLASRLIIDAGAVYLNAKYDETNDEFIEGVPLGVTFGENQFLLEMELRDVEANGVKGSIKGGKLVESMKPQLKLNLKELTAKNLQMSIAGSKLDTTTSQKWDIIKSVGCIPLADYIDSVALVGRVGATCDSGHSGQPVIIVLENVLNTEPFSVKMTDKNEVVLPISFEAHYTSKEIENGTHPYAIYFPKEVVPTP
ncbi:MAG: hypothetical protein RR440_00300 [Erysipelotrichaceae bacterium]